MIPTRRLPLWFKRAEWIARLVTLLRTFQPACGTKRNVPDNGCRMAVHDDLASGVHGEPATPCRVTARLCASRSYSHSYFADSGKVRLQFGLLSPGGVDLWNRSLTL